MKYNRTFIAAVHETAQSFGPTAAEELFNKLFDVNAVDYPVPVPVKSPEDLMLELDKIVGTAIYRWDIHQAVHAYGMPTHNPSSSSKVSWIKTFREHANVGLKQAVDTYNFVRDNPTILD